ncbi:type I-E CRISPR-associated protein Cas7/Cse4/CasC [Lipingzhangella sp. LS1_29]|uniref:Type I-E CRISPR-associated protein Cas7/Cse4/CasC n=1 Tax=Lipingzhangella rawalii TaxID=2055835 RepID=A0ABU2HAB9_9ACTN|nr:type I-E CRISPR-associated protein Cas7/Cse4/CasC [Lipingzhangella rawalii]MDS1272258.1 type I-E CRISPR-associated protein Cas7/Cse4/CasC [Lipingzhangella rawalii]
MAKTIVDVHVLQTVPPSNLNRDDTGSPKTAYFGGVLRSRVSSQAWKRATRLAFEDLLSPQELGTRTKRVAKFIADRIQQLDATVPEQKAWELAAHTVTTATGSKIEAPKRKSKSTGEDGADASVDPESAYLMFLSARQRDALAELALEGSDDIATFFKDKDAKQRAKRLANTHHSVDIGLFGRMVADGADVNVDAAAQVAHALSVHAIEPDSDYYTAVDDLKDRSDPGAGMIGAIEFNSATLYRYAAVDVDQLQRNLGAGLREDEDSAQPVRRAVEAFLRGFVESLPSGKVNTFGNNTLPEAVVVKVRTRRPLSFVSAFEEPVQAGTDGADTSAGYLRSACERLARHVPQLETAYGADANAGTETWVMRVGEATAALAHLGREVTLPQLVEQAGTAAARPAEAR